MKKRVQLINGKIPVIASNINEIKKNEIDINSLKSNNENYLVSLLDEFPNMFRYMDSSSVEIRQINYEFAKVPLEELEHLGIKNVGDVFYMPEEYVNTTNPLILTKLTEYELCEAFGKSGYSTTNEINKLKCLYYSPLIYNKDYIVLTPKLAYNTNSNNSEKKVQYLIKGSTEALYAIEWIEDYFKSIKSGIVMIIP